MCPIPFPKELSQKSYKGYGESVGEFTDSQSHGRIHLGLVAPFTIYHRTKLQYSGRKVRILFRIVLNVVMMAKILIIRPKINPGHIVDKHNRHICRGYNFALQYGVSIHKKTLLMCTFFIWGF